MKQMKIDDNSFSEATVNETNNTSATNTIASDKSGETFEQLTKINNTLLLIVDKISAIETEIKMLKEVKQQRCDDDEEHIKLQIEEKEVDVINSAESVAENLDEEVEDSDDEIVDVECDEVDVLEEVLSSLKNVEENLEKVEADEVSDAEVSDDEKKEEDVVEEEDEVEVVEEEEVLEEEVVNLEDDEETDESEVEIEDEVADKPKSSKNLEEVKSEAVNLEEDEEEVFEIEIDDITYFATHEENGILYEVDKDGDVGKKVGIIKDGEPIFL